MTKTTKDEDQTKKSCKLYETCVKKEKDIEENENKIKKNKLYGPFLWMGFNCLKATATLRRQFTFYH